MPNSKPKSQSRKSSKSSRNWRHSRYNPERNETREQRALRIAATKKNSKKRKSQAKYKPAKETADTKTERVLKTREAALKMLQKWANSKSVEAFVAAHKGRYYGLTWWLHGALNDLTQTLNELTREEVERQSKAKKKK